MGNRFAGIPQYRSLIRGHGVVATLTFLFIVPAAILIAHFYHPNPRLALRVHIWLQVLTFFLTTVVFILGNFAVGPDRALTNPHHGIFVLVRVQFLGGNLIHRRERKKNRERVPLTLYVSAKPLSRISGK